MTLWSFKLSEEKQDNIKQNEKRHRLDYKEKYLLEKEQRIVMEERTNELTKALKEANQIIIKLEELKEKK